MKRAHALVIEESAAEKIKCEVWSAAALEKSLRMEVKGRHQSEGLPRTVTVTDGEIRDALSEPIRGILKAILEALERVPPELSADIYDRGVVLTGGGALLRKMDKHLAKETGLRVILAEKPLDTVVMGTGHLLSNRRLLDRVAIA